MESVIVIGASHTGVDCADALRRTGFAGRLSVIGSGADLPTECPSLSKAFLLADPEVGLADEGGHSVWSYDAGRLCAVDAVRDTAGYMIGKRCLEAGLSPHPDDVANPDFDLKSYLARQ